MADDLQDYLKPGTYIDSDHPDVVAYAQQVAGDGGTDVERAVRLYYAVRDDVLYDLYVAYGQDATYRASSVLAAGRGFCVGKASLLAAACRAVGIPARVGYADVRNHLCTPRLRKLMGTDLFTWHGYTDIFLDGRWAKATPAFNRTLCETFGVKTLEFDGRADSLLQEFDHAGNRHMEYKAQRGVYADVPVDEIVADFRERYRDLFGDGTRGAGGDFTAEAAEV
ncbi:MAG: transglutaminase domain-containing protein [Hyphomicrobiales bacterium]|nr:transglutaminase domain-containing protein [Hyphomicrobiales bacterium]MCP5372590.1 transglutaminase domain-containing protein [Hyphomicrobiales bacterium]